MMLGIVLTVCLFAGGLIAIWFSPWRSRLLQTFSAVDRFRFMCRVEQFIDESQPSREDQFFRVQMIGRILTTEDNVSTDVQVEIQDVTEGRLHPLQVLSTDEDYRDDTNAGFYYTQHNGIVPHKNAVLARWATVAQFPCHILRFPDRGRRKLNFLVTVLDAESGQKIVTAQKTVEYVYCSDGYREVHTRRCDVLRSCVELAVFSLAQNPPFQDEIKTIWSEWIQEKSELFMSSEEACKIVEGVEKNASVLTIKTSSDVLLAYGQGTDTFLALELALQTAGFSRIVTMKTFNRLSHIAEALNIRQDRFLKLSQKILLASGCNFEEPSCLLGISSEMDEESFRKRLNEEYRKWNARVTHPDAQIRSQADQILSLIAEIRTRRLQSCS